MIELEKNYINLFLKALNLDFKEENKDNQLKGYFNEKSDEQMNFEKPGRQSFGQSFQACQASQALKAPESVLDKENSTHLTKAMNNMLNSVLNAEKNITLTVKAEDDFVRKLVFEIEEEKKRSGEKEI